MAEENVKDEKETGSLEEKLVEAEKKRDEYLAGWQRAKADFINYKKDELKRLEEIGKYGSESLISELISVLDNFDLGIIALEKNGSVEKGVYMIRSQFQDVLKRFGLTRIDIAIGSQFDPSVSEAIAEVDSPPGENLPPGSVVEVIEPGYMLYEKLIRPARVKVVRNH